MEPFINPINPLSSLNGSAEPITHVQRAEHPAISVGIRLTIWGNVKRRVEEACGIWGNGLQPLLALTTSDVKQADVSWEAAVPDVKLGAGLVPLNGVFVLRDSLHQLRAYSIDWIERKPLIIPRQHKMTVRRDKGSDCLRASLGGPSRPKPNRQHMRGAAFLPRLR